MNPERLENLDPRVQRALDEIRGVIAQRYPSATFEVTRDVDEPENIDLVTTVDLDDPDEVLDLVIDQLVDFQVEQRIPLHVVPIRTPDRILAELRSPRRIGHGLHRNVSSTIARQPRAETAENGAAVRRSPPKLWLSELRQKP